MVARLIPCLWSLDPASYLFLSQRRVYAASPLVCGGGKKTNIRLRGYEMRAALDRLDLPLDIAVPTAAGDDAVVARSFDHAFLRRDNVRIVEFSRLAHVGEQIVAAEMDDI